MDLKCDHLPYLVEFDNFGISSDPGKYDPTGTWHWGYDEITWFSLLPENERNDFLKYAVSWVKKTDPIGKVQMPGRRVISLNNGTWGNLYRANTASGNMTNYGYNQELTIRQIWNEN